MKSFILLIFVIIILFLFYEFYFKKKNLKETLKNQNKNKKDNYLHGSKIINPNLEYGIRRCTKWEEIPKLNSCNK